MNRRHLAAVSVATAGCLVLSLLVSRLRPFSGNPQVQAEAASVPAGTLSISPSFPGAPTDRSPEVYQGSFLYSTASEMLAHLGVTVYPQDRVYAFPDPALGIGSTIEVYRAQPVTVADATGTQSFRTWAATVGDLLAQQGIELGSQDEISPSLDTPIALGPNAFQISITRVAETQLVLTSSIAYSVTYQDDPTQIQGQTSVSQAGKDGVLQKTYQVRRENGAEVSRTLLSSQVTQAPVSEIILRGTKPKVVHLTSSEYAQYFNEAADQYGVDPTKLQKVMMCESGGNVNDINPVGPYYGLFQFDAHTWASTAYGSRSIYDPEAQILAAASLWQWHSAKWPACSRGL